MKTPERRQAEIRVLRTMIDRLKRMYSGYEASNVIAKMTTELLMLEEEEREGRKTEQSEDVTSEMP